MFGNNRKQLAKLMDSPPPSLPGLQILIVKRLGECIPIPIFGEIRSGAPGDIGITETDVFMSPDSPSKMLKYSDLYFI